MKVYLCVIILSAYFLFEVSFHRLIRFLNKRFQWLIIAKDKYPVFSDHLLDKFFQDGFDPELGWSRKPNTSKAETGREGLTRYHINDQGVRLNPEHENWPVRISTFGDSFTFGRQVNDHQTFQWHLSEMTHSNVLNYGVGNYGLDQAFLRLKREYQDNQKIVIIGVVPSTIVRIVSVWKHYNEFGNILAFKPRFMLKEGKLTLIPNLINSPDKFKNYHDYLPIIQEYDAFYQSKFLPEMLHFPYVYTLLKNPKRHFALIQSVIRELGKKTQFQQSLAQIMAHNLTLRKNLFQGSQALLLLNKLIEAFVEFARENHFTPLLLWMPQKDDVSDIQQYGNYYEGFIKTARAQCEVIDLTQALCELPNLDLYYSDDSVYGGHFSPAGNQLVAQLIYAHLTQYRHIAVANHAMHLMKEESADAS